MKIKLSKKTIRLIALAVGIFIIAFFVAQVLNTGNTSKGGGSTPPGRSYKTEIKKSNSDFTVIFVIIGLVAVAVGYGVYSEKKRRRRD